MNHDGDDRHERLVQSCRYCGGHILWAVTTRNDKWIPLNPRTDEHGNVSLARSRSGLHATVFGPGEAGRRRAAGERLYLAHVATCARDHQRGRTTPLRAGSRSR